MSPSRRAIALAVALFLSGCGDDAGECRIPSGSPAPTRTLSIGDEVGAWEDGQTVPLVYGGQGGVMVVPVVRLPAEASDGDELCALVSIRNESTVEELSVGTERLVVFRREGDQLVSPPIEDFFGFSPSPFVDQMVTLDVRLVDQSSTFAAQGMVTLVIAPPS